MTSLGPPDLVLHPSVTTAHGLLCEAGSRTLHPADGSVLAVTGGIGVVISGFWRVVSCPQSQPLVKS